MKRALGFLALLMVCPAPARADGMDDAVASVASLGDDCDGALEHADLLLEVGELSEDDLARVENDRSVLEVLCPMLHEDGEMAREMLAAFRSCSSDCDDAKLGVTMVLQKAQVEGQTMFEIMQRLGSMGEVGGVSDDPVDAPSRHSIYLSTTGVSIDVPVTWEVSDGDDADLILEGGALIGAVIPQSVYDCDTIVAGGRDDYADHYDATISLPSRWSGVEFAVQGELGGLYCRQGDGSNVIVSAAADIAAVLIGGIEAALTPSATEDVGDPYVAPTDAGPIPETPRRGGGVIGGFLPRTYQFALVRRRDDMGAGFGFGLQLGRLGWREDERFTIGYEVGAAAATGFWELGAQVRPALSPMLKDLPAYAYAALGVDVIGGKHQEETDVQPVFGAGAEVLFTLPGIGGEVAGQVLADPGGFHAYTLHGGVLFGQHAGRFRVGASYVKLADDTTLLWMTLGFTKLELR